MKGRVGVMGGGLFEVCALFSFFLSFFLFGKADIADRIDRQI